MEPPYYVPPPASDDYWDPAAPRCEECGSILQNTHPDADGEWTGWCPTHDRVPLYYSDYQLPDKGEEDDA